MNSSSRRMAAVPRGTETEITRRQRGLMAILDSAARHEKQCPTLGQIGTLLGLSTDIASELLNQLRDAGKIRWTVQYRGAGLGNVRVVTIVETGQTTALPAMAGRPRGSVDKQAKAKSNEFERAKTALRRFGRVVFNAEITDGPAGKGLIKVDGRNMEPLAMLRFAQDSGVL